ncbi:hypothetical protein [Bifidobacterium gallicum]|uniref:Putative Tat pathway signal sequence n=1 Tax=Bifidobacterium gallicum DSM 20093 = LMG 11596 TaxID=561180 RepID=D1NWP5_9BIFI|nr:hypothetical protein [Bifidobacterium gallicum]EFA22204.1 Tat pathway signal sequence domain protein [Bifidobacterium gallicum DSM 20093 = LMG 11596]KFI59060.1 putative Tat pathway signal sequence [Bifidobacterium gallicum DSM 20093 = LMG 11596]
MSETSEKTKTAQRPHEPTRHAKIMRGIVTPIFGLLAVCFIVFGVLNATIWKPSRHIEASAHVQKTQYIMVDSGVLGSVDKDVTVSVLPSNTQADVCMAVGTQKDAAGWVEGHPYVRVTGLDSWTQLSTVDQQAHGTASPSGNDVEFGDSDMWREHVCTVGQARLSLKDMVNTPLVALIDLGATDPASTVTMEWDRQQVPDFAMPFYFAAGLCAILAVLCASVFALEPARRRKAMGLDGMDDDASTFQKIRHVVHGDDDEVSVGEAVAGTFKTVGRSLKRKPRDPAKGHRRHAKAEKPSSPAIVDPSNRNMVADAAAAATVGATSVVNAMDGAEVPEEETAVISPDELQAYFARLAREEHVELPEAPTGELAPVSVNEPHDELDQYDQHDAASGVQDAADDANTESDGVEDGNAEDNSVAEGNSTEADNDADDTADNDNADGDNTADDNTADDSTAADSVEDDSAADGTTAELSADGDNGAADDNVGDDNADIAQADEHDQQEPDEDASTEEGTQQDESDGPTEAEQATSQDEKSTSEHDEEQAEREEEDER